jgi:SM-20-related protein
VTDDEIRALGTQCYFIRDGFLGPQRARAAYDFALRMHDTLKPAGIGTDGRRDTRVRADLTAWLDDSPLHPAFTELMQQLNSGAYLGLRGFQVQLACYPGGGAHYARHVDAPPGHKLRRVTGIVYLNPDWKPEHGGQLRLHLDPVLDVEPVLDRLVVFLSEKVPHEVLPAFDTRYAVTSWFRVL